MLEPRMIAARNAEEAKEIAAWFESTPHDTRWAETRSGTTSGVEWAEKYLEEGRYLRPGLFLFTDVEEVFDFLWSEDPHPDIGGLMLQWCDCDSDKFDVESYTYCTYAPVFNHFQHYTWDEIQSMTEAEQAAYKQFLDTGVLIQPPPEVAVEEEPEPEEEAIAEEESVESVDLLTVGLGVLGLGAALKMKKEETYGMEKRC